MDSVQAVDLKQLDIADVKGLLADIFNHGHAFLPIDPDDVGSIMETYHTSHVTKATGIASGPGKGLKAAQLALAGLPNIRGAGWLLIDVNVHPDESDALAVYDAAVNHVHPLANDNMDILCGLRMDCDVFDMAVVTIVFGRD